MAASQPVENQYHFAKFLGTHGVSLQSQGVQTLQVNITRLCNQACVHCHVDSSPRRREAMNDQVVDKVIDIMLGNHHPDTLDITGGAPELHPRFKELVERVRRAGRKVIVRHNLTVTQEPHPLTQEDMQYLPNFFAEFGVEVVSSLPYYQEYFTDKQRGSGVFQKSILSLQQLNQYGYGKGDGSRVLNLVYNPVGAFLPPPQAQLEGSYKKELKERFGIQFDRLLAITNMPIHRFKAQLRRLDSYEEYMEKLVSSFNVAAADEVMCKQLISVGYDGRLYDCDFNQVLDMDIIHQGKPLTIFDWNLENISRRTIRTADHCFGCTAGAGSSCGGTTTKS